MRHLQSRAREAILTDAPVSLFGSEQPVQKDQRGVAWFGLMRLVQIVCQAQLALRTARKTIMSPGSTER